MSALAVREFRRQAARPIIGHLGVGPENIRHDTILEHDRWTAVDVREWPAVLTDVVMDGFARTLREFAMNGPE